MGRIEISLEEYQGLKSKIKDLEKKYYDTYNKLVSYEKKIKNIKEISEDLYDEPIGDRVFRWKKITEPLKNILEYE